ncbi:hypothetical protein ACG02S_19440 [Roseateles sp. DC23W]|uniref:Lipoprotein n=1 Tax=Pelomonas dachongensis TaxID=3299029 RepID=A0ABW7ERK6_9BURK
MRRADARCRAWWGVALVAALAACSDGYPTEDMPRTSPFDMSREQRLATLNRLAKKAHPERRWRYAMTAACELRVDFRRKGAGTTRTAVQLAREMEVEVVFDKADRTFNVVLLADRQPGTEVLATLLQSKAWTDASQAELVLQLLTRDCEPPPPDDGRAG